MIREYDQFAQRVVERLDQLPLSAEVVSGLRQARRKALVQVQHSAHSHGPVLVVAWLRRHPLWAFASLASIGWLLWALNKPVQMDQDEIDLLLLSSELPPQAYVHKEFPQWVRSVSH